MSVFLLPVVASIGQGIISGKFLLKCKYVTYEETCTDSPKPLALTSFFPKREGTKDWDIGQGMPCLNMVYTLLSMASTMQPPPHIAEQENSGNSSLEMQANTCSLLPTGYCGAAVLCGLVWV